MYYVQHNCIKSVFYYLLLSNSETIFEAILLDHHPFPFVTNDSISSIFNHFSNVGEFKIHYLDESIKTSNKSVFLYQL